MRNILIIHLIDERKGSLTEKEQNNQNRFCGGSWKSPKSCDQQKHDCEYFAKWEYFSQRDEIKFDIETTHTNTWTGIAFSNDQKMVSLLFILVCPCVHQRSSINLS